MAAFLLNFMSARETSGSHGIGVARAVADLEGWVQGEGGGGCTSPIFDQISPFIAKLLPILRR